MAVRKTVYSFSGGWSTILVDKLWKGERTVLADESSYQTEGAVLAIGRKIAAQIRIVCRILPDDRPSSGRRRGCHSLPLCRHPRTVRAWQSDDTTKCQANCTMYDFF